MAQWLRWVGCSETEQKERDKAKQVLIGGGLAVSASGTCCHSEPRGVKLDSAEDLGGVR